MNRPTNNKKEKKGDRAMEKVIVFLAGVDEVLKEWAKDVTGHCESFLRLVGIELWTLFILAASMCCLVDCIWLSNYYWYAIPGAVFSPVALWQSVYIIGLASRRAYFLRRS